jgi:hypothetical protein
MSGNQVRLSQYNIEGRELLRRTADIALGFLSNVEARRVGAGVAPAIGDPLPEIGEDPRLVIESMARAAEAVSSRTVPRYSAS